MNKFLVLFPLLVILGCFEKKDEYVEGYDDPLINSHRILHVKVNQPEGFDVKVTSTFYTASDKKSCKYISSLNGEYEPKKDYCYYNFADKNKEVYVPIKYPKKSSCKWLFNHMSIIINYDSISTGQLTIPVYAKRNNDFNNQSVKEPIDIHYSHHVNNAFNPPKHFYKGKIINRESDSYGDIGIFSFYNAFSDTIDITLNITIDTVLLKD